MQLFFNNISDHLPLLSCKKKSPDGFITSLSDKKIKWSSHICRDKHEAFFTHNKFTCPLDEFKYNDNLDSIVKKFFISTDELGDEIHVISS